MNLRKGVGTGNWKRTHWITLWRIRFGRGYGPVGRNFSMNYLYCQNQIWYGVPEFIHGTINSHYLGTNSTRINMNKVVKLMSKTQVNQTPTFSAKQSKDAPTTS